VPKDEVNTYNHIEYVTKIMHIRSPSFGAHGRLSTSTWLCAQIIVDDIDTTAQEQVCRDVTELTQVILVTAQL